MRLPLPFVQAADRAGAPIVGPVPPQRPMHAVDELQGELGVPRLPGRARETQEVAHGEGIRPQVALSRSPAARCGALREAKHQLHGLVGTLVGIVQGCTTGERQSPNG
jgi:hypothetical protein